MVRLGSCAAAPAAHEPLESGLAGRELQEAAGVERGLDGARGGPAIETLSGRHRVQRGVVERSVHSEVELRIDDQGAGPGVPERVADVPERTRPDLAVGVNLADHVLWIVLASV